MFHHILPREIRDTTDHLELDFTDIGVSLNSGVLELSDSLKQGMEPINIPDTNPRVLQISWSESREPIILLLDFESEVREEVRIGKLEILALDGTRYLIQDANSIDVELPPAVPKKETTTTSLKEHFEEAIESLLDGKLTFVLGLDINPAQHLSWESKQDYLPNSRELAAYLTNKDIKGKNFNLAKVAQAFIVNKKYRYNPLYDRLNRIYEKRYNPRPIDDFFVNLSRELEKVSAPKHSVKHPVILTANYDCMLEKTFKEANQSFDLLYVLPLKEYSGKFAHVCFDGKTGFSETNVIEEPNRYLLEPYQKPLIIKVNGTVNSQVINEKNQWSSNYIITEDDHLDNLAYGGIARQIPVRILAQLKQNGFLSLGMDLKDWSIRNIFRRIWGYQVEYPSWVIQENINIEEESYWNLYSVDMVEVKLDRYIDSLTAEINKLLSQ